MSYVLPASASVFDFGFQRLLVLCDSAPQRCAYLLVRCGLPHCQISNGTVVGILQLLLGFLQLSCDFLGMLLQVNASDKFAPFFLELCFLLFGGGTRQFQCGVCEASFDP
jgi:hypothetical protein